jgi:acyl carrier protein
MQMDLQERVVDIVASALRLPKENIRLDANLKDDLGATSLDRYTILMDIEREFSLNLDDEPDDALEEKIRSVADIVLFLRERLKGT